MATCGSCCGSADVPNFPTRTARGARASAFPSASGGGGGGGGGGGFLTHRSAEDVPSAPRVFSAPQAFPATIGEIVPPSQLSGGAASTPEMLGAGFIEGTFRVIGEQQALPPAPYYTQFEEQQFLPAPAPLMLPEPSQDLIMQFALENVAQAVDY